MAYYGIATNLVLYLTREMKEGTVKSSNSVTNWVGTVWITPILGAYIADTYLGRYWTFMVASVIYLIVRTLISWSLVSIKKSVLHALILKQNELMMSLFLVFRNRECFY